MCIKKFVAVKHQDVMGRFCPDKSVRAKKDLFGAVGKENSVSAEKFSAR